MKLVKIKDEPNLIRDLETNAILNVNYNKEIEDFNLKRQKIIQEKKDKEETKIRLAKIEEDMLEIKNLLKEISLLRSKDVN
jgi:hypothetical protein